MMWPLDMPLGVPDAPLSPPFERELCSSCHGTAENAAHVRVTPGRSSTATRTATSTLGRRYPAASADPRSPATRSSQRGTWTRGTCAGFRIARADLPEPRRQPVEPGFARAGAPLRRLTRLRPGHDRARRTGV